MYQYTLEKGSVKYYCPNCKAKTFVKYIDTETGEYLPEQYGRCDRENKCSYYLNPYSDGYSKTNVKQQKQFHIIKKTEPQPEPAFFDLDTFKQTLQPERYKENTFIQNLFYNVAFPFNVDDVTKVVQLYRLGTVAKGNWKGAITFPFIDIENNVRAIQVKHFDKKNHTLSTNFLHSIIEKHYTRNNKPLPEWLKKYIDQDKKITCLFGEHLLNKYPSNPVALVEAPKTAVYGTLYFGLPETPEDLIWLAVYNKSSFSFDKLKVLQGRLVFVFPDLSINRNTFKEWKNKAKEYESRLPRTRFIFSDLLEKLAPDQDKTEGKDIADYLIKQDWKQFRERQQDPQPEPEKVTKVTEVTHKTKHIYSHTEPLLKIEQIVPHKKTENWDKIISELENCFSNIEIPKQPVKLSHCTTIINCSTFIEKHLAFIKANNGNKTFLPYLSRLQELRNILK